MSRTWPCERCRRGDGRRSASVTRWMIWRRVYGNAMYGSSDFDQMKNKVHCSVCHGEGHTMNRHKQGPKWR
jgi:ribonuclease PH